MNRKLSWLTLGAAVWVLAACSSGNSSPSAATPPPASPPPPPAVAMVSGAVVDNFVLSSTVTAYAVSSAGAVGACIPSTPATTPPGCATATSDSSGNYAVNLGSYSGAVLLQATGGTYTDTVTGQTGLPIPSSLILSVLLPTVAPGSAATVAQITPLTTIAAQLALQQVAQGSALATAISSAQSEVETYFGGLADIVGTAIVDLSKADCSAATNQASADGSLIIDGIAQLASQYNVTSAALIGAILEDVVSDGSFDGNDSGTPIMVPLAAGGGSVALASIYGSSLAQSLWTSIAAFQASAINACQASASSGLHQHLVSGTSNNVQNAQYAYTVSGTYTLTGQFITNPQIALSMLLPGLQGKNACTGDAGGNGNAGLDHNMEQATTTLALGQQQPFSVSITGTPATNLETNQPDYNWNDSCGTIAATVFIAPAAGQTCNILSGPSGSMTFTSSDSTDNGNHNAITEGTNTVIECSIDVEAVTGTVSNLASGTTLTVTVADATSPTNSSAATVVGSGVSPQPLSFAAGGVASPGVQYNDLVTITAAVTQPSSGPTQTCTITGQGTPTTPVTAPLTLTVTCTTGGGTGPGGPATAIAGPGGMAFDSNGNLWVTNSDGSTGSVLEFSVTRDGSNNATALTQVGRIVTGINGPSRLAFDAAGNLYVANIGSNDVTIYEPVGLTQIGTIASNIQRPLGVAVDGSGHVYVANNSANSVTVCTPPAGTLSASNSSFNCPTVLSGDGSVPSNPFSAPGVLSFFPVPQSLAALLPPGSPTTFLFIGLGPSSGADSVLMYDTLPLQSTSTPFFDLSNGDNCSTGPSGPTAVAVSYDANDTVHPLLFYVASYYSNTVAAFDVLGIIENHTDLCPAPYASISGSGGNIAQPEGLAVDADRNVFVSDSSANHITVYNPGSSSSTPTYRFTYSGGT
jgi:hypothetical protein